MSVLLLAAGAAHAAEKAKRKAVPGPKPSFDLSMQVVIVRSSAKGCEPMCTEWIMAEGMITAETPKALQQALSQGPKGPSSLETHATFSSADFSIRPTRSLTMRLRSKSLGV